MVGATHLTVDKDNRSQGLFSPSSVSSGPTRALVPGHQKDGGDPRVDRFYKMNPCVSMTTGGAWCPRRRPERPLSVLLRWTVTKKVSLATPPSFPSNVGEEVPPEDDGRV